MRPCDFDGQVTTGAIYGAGRVTLVDADRRTRSLGAVAAEEARSSNAKSNATSRPRVAARSRAALQEVMEI